MSNSIPANWREARACRQNEGRNVFIYLDFDYLACERSQPVWDHLSRFSYNSTLENGLWENREIPGARPFSASVHFSSLLLRGIFSCSFGSFSIELQRHTDRKCQVLHVSRIFYKIDRACLKRIALNYHWLHSKYIKYTVSHAWIQFAIWK